MFIIDLTETHAIISFVEVKAHEAHEMDRLEAALDLGARQDRIGPVAARAVHSLAGAADVAVLVWDRCQEGGGIPAWAAGLGFDSPVLRWLRSRVHRTGGLYARAVPIPTSASEHAPASPFVAFQDEAAARLCERGMPRAKALKILGAFAEMADNTIDHSESPVEPFATFEISRSWWEFSVSDVGRGAPNSLRTNPRYAGLTDHDAVREALKDGVSRFDDATRGSGYGVMLRALAEHDCAIRLRTGHVVVRWSGRGVGLTDLIYELVGPRVGLHVRVAGRF